MKLSVPSRSKIAMLVIGMLGSSNAFAATTPTVTSWSNGATVTSTSQTIRGGCVSGENVRFWGDIVGFVVNVTCVNSAYSSNFTLNSGNGSKSITIKALDSRGGTSAYLYRTLNLSAGSSTPTVGAPSISTPSSGAYVRAIAQTVSGSCQSGAVVSISGSVQSAPQTVTCSNGAYSRSVSLTTGDGSKTIRVTQRASNVTSSEVSRSINLDTSAPSTPTVSSPNSGATVSSTSLNISGACESSSTVRISGAIQSSPRTVTCSNNAYSLGVVLNSGAGSKALSVSQVDRAGNASGARSLSVNLSGGTTTPTIGAPSISSPASGIYVRAVAQTVSGSCQSGATVTISGNIQSTQSLSCSNGAYSRSVSLSTGDGSKTIRVRQSASGVTSSEVSRSLNLDTSAPSAPTVSSPSNGATVSSTSLNISGACESSSTVSISGAIQSSPRTVSCSNSAYSLGIVLNSGAGSKALSVSQVDRAGNASSARSLSVNLSGGTTPTPTPSPSPSPSPGNFVTVFDCNQSNFVATTTASTAPCAVDLTGWRNPPNGFEIAGGPAQEVSVENGRVYLSRGNGGHLASNMVYQRQVNARAFDATFTFVPSGKNIAFVLQNSVTSSYGFNGRNFNAGAGCEAGFFQAFTGGDPAVDRIFALALMQDMPLRSVNANRANDYFEYSSAMIYKTGESPCSYMPTPAWASQTPFSIPTKISTYPVALNGPANVPLTSTGDNYSARIRYDGSNVTLDLHNVTRGGSCPGANCFSRTWNNVNIPALVGGNTAWVSISAGCNSDCVRRVNVNSFRYSAPAN